MIRVTDLHFRYPGAARDTLLGVGLAVEPGEIVGLLGPSGSGKTTTVNVITGALPGYRGTVAVLGRPGAADRSRLARIGVGFEVPSVYPRLTARENLTLFGALYGRASVDVSGLLGSVGLQGTEDTRVERFSKGMRSRLDLCRALLPEPELLFLDEPTSALDPGHARTVRELIRDFADRGGSVLLTTHDMHVAEALCDRVALIVGGRVVACDAPATLRRGPAEPTVRIEVASGAQITPRSVAMSDLADDAELRALIRQGRVRTLHSCEPTLEDVFLELTGEALR